MSKWQKHLPIEIGSFIITDASFESMITVVWLFRLSRIEWWLLVKQALSNFLPKIKAQALQNFEYK
jgi:hypothetical protein